MPQRFLKPRIRTSPRWNAISHAAARLYIALITQVDDFGLYDGRVSVLWSDAFAVWNEQNPDNQVTYDQCSDLCEELEREKLVMFYTVDKRRYCAMNQWQERARSKDSKWPLPPAALQHVATKMLANGSEMQTFASNLPQKNASPALSPPPPPPSPSREPAPLANDIAPAAANGGGDKAGGDLEALFEMQWCKWKQHSSEMTYPITATALQQQKETCLGWGLERAIQSLKTALDNNSNKLKEPPYKPEHNVF